MARHPGHSSQLAALACPRICTVQAIKWGVVFLLLLLFFFFFFFFFGAIRILGLSGGGRVEAEGPNCSPQLPRGTQALLRLIPLWPE